MTNHVVLLELDQETQPQTLGDCLLHRTHHELQPECWDKIAEATFEIMDARKHRFIDECRDWYKWYYEQAILADIVLAEYEDKA